MINEFQKISDTINEKKYNRTEPDVILNFKEEGLVIIEVKYRSKNDEKPCYKHFPKYTDNCKNIFKDTEEIKKIGLYELTRNWRFGYELSKSLKKGSFFLVNLGPKQLFENTNKSKLDEFEKAINKDKNHQFMPILWKDFLENINCEKPLWFKEYICKKFRSLK